MRTGRQQGQPLEHPVPPSRKAASRLLGRSGLLDLSRLGLQPVALERPLTRRKEYNRPARSFSRTQTGRRRHAGSRTIPFSDSSIRRTQDRSRHGVSPARGENGSVAGAATSPVQDEIRVFSSTRWLRAARSDGGSLPTPNVDIRRVSQRNELATCGGAGARSRDAPQFVPLQVSSQTPPAAASRESGRDRRIFRNGPQTGSGLDCS